MTRNAMFIVLAGLLLAAAAPAEEPGLDEVLSRYFAAIGGLESIDAVRTAKVSGARLEGELESPYIQYFERPNKTRRVMTVKGKTTIQAFDGETAWMLWPFPPYGSPEPALMPNAWAAEFEPDADFFGPLHNWQGNGHRVELAGTEEIDGRPAFMLEVELATGSKRTYYLDGETYLMVRQTSRDELSNVDFDTRVTDYRKVSGLLLPHLFSIAVDWAGQQSTVTNRIDAVEINLEFESDLFAMPEASNADSGEESESQP